jgi:hypothetical protein
LALAEDPRSVDPADRIVFQELGWNDRDVAREVGRCTSLKRWKREAGTPGAFADAVEQLDAVQKVVPKKIAELQAKIDELRSKIDDETSKLAKIQNQVDSFEYARKMLRENVPSYVRKQFDDEVARIRSTDSADRLRELRARQRTILGVLENLSIVNAHTVAQIRLHCQAVGLANVVPPPSENWNGNRFIDERVWHGYLDSLRVELPTIESELLELEADFDEQLASAETILDYYLEGK